MCARHGLPTAPDQTASAEKPRQPVEDLHRRSRDRHLIEVWQRGRIVKIVVGEESLSIDQDDVPLLIMELAGNDKGQWSKGDLERLVALHHEGRKPREIARIIGRDPKSTNAKLFNLRRKGALD